MAPNNRRLTQRSETVARWFYRSEGIFGDKDHGPFDDEAFKQIIRDNKLTRGTLIQKDGQWFNAGDLFGAAIDQAAARAAAAKQEAKAAADAAKREEKAKAAELKVREAEAQRQAAEAKARAAEAERAIAAAAAPKHEISAPVPAPPVHSPAMMPTTGNEQLPPGSLRCPHCKQIVYPQHQYRSDGNSQALSCIAIVLLSLVTCGIALIFLVVVPWFGRKSIAVCPNCHLQIGSA